MTPEQKQLIYKAGIDSVRHYMKKVGSADTPQDRAVGMIQPLRELYHAMRTFSGASFTPLQTERVEMARDGVNRAILALNAIFEDSPAEHRVESRHDVEVTPDGLECKRCGLIAHGDFEDFKICPGKTHE